MAKVDNLYEVHLALEEAGIPITGVSFDEAQDTIVVDFQPEANPGDRNRADKIVADFNHDKTTGRKKFRQKFPVEELVEEILDWIETGQRGATLNKALAERKKVK